jgi:hypothetical protein
MVEYFSIPDRLNVSTYTARRSASPSPPRGPYHSRRTLCRTTQAIKTTPAAADGSNIKFSSVTELFLSSATTSYEERCSPPPRTRRRFNRPHSLCHGRTVTNKLGLPSRKRRWKLLRQLWCTLVNAIRWPFFEPMYRRSLGNFSTPYEGGCVQRIAHRSIGFPSRYGRNSLKTGSDPCFPLLIRVGMRRALIPVFALGGSEFLLLET